MREWASEGRPSVPDIAEVHDGGGEVSEDAVGAAQGFGAVETTGHR